MTGPDLQPTFRALADPTRRRIIDLLAHQNLSVGDVAAQFDMTRAAVKKHLVVLEEGHIVASQAQGRERIHQLQPDALQAACAWLHRFDSFWDARLGALKSAVETTPQTKDKT